MQNSLISAGTHFVNNYERYSNYYNAAQRTMPYLRGTVAKYIKPRGATKYASDLALRSLQRQVNRQKPELQQYVSTATTSTPINGFSQWNLSPTEVLAAATDRDERVLGDSWINKSLELRFSAGTNINGFPGPIRIIVYVPKKAGTSITFTDLTDMTDPSQITVLHDMFCKPLISNLEPTTAGFDAGVYQVVRKLSLGNRKSTFIGTTPEKNNIRIAVLSHGYWTSAGSNTFSMKMKLNYTNK